MSAQLVARHRGVPALKAARAVSQALSLAKRNDARSRVEPGKLLTHDIARAVGVIYDRGGNQRSSDENRERSGVLLHAQQYAARQDTAMSNQADHA
jgi:hypothetical protein